MLRTRPKVLFIIGTRPEAIKLAPLARAFQADGHFEAVVCLSGQHEEMALEVLGFFAITPHHNLSNSGLEGQTFSEKAAGLMASLEGVIRKEQPDWVFVQGDTLTAFCGALAGFYTGIPVAHVEAGLRTHDPLDPFPEEAHRKMVTALATLHFSPTEQARRNLLRENVHEERIFITGNTGIDALIQVRRQLAGADEALAGKFEALAGSPLERNRKIVTVTFHRWENRADKMPEILEALNAVARFENAQAVFPVHPNPLIQRAIRDFRKGPVLITPPLPYGVFVWLMQQSFLIITDSGGIQEEAATLGAPVILVRASTERPEALASENLLLVEAKRDEIISVAAELWKGGEMYRRMAKPRLLFGDGEASGRILAFFRDYLKRG